MANNAQNVSFGKPKATGAVYIAPKGTTLPTDATTTLATAYVDMGYISEDGYTQSTETDTQQIRDWNGRVVLEGQSSYAETHTVNFIETNVETLKVIYGASNVTQADNVITVNSTGAELEEHVVVIELALTNGRVQRIVIPRAKIVDRSGERTYNATSAISYPAQFSATPDNNGNYHISYTSVVSA
jgi:hypothetical protein